MGKFHGDGILAQTHTRLISHRTPNAMHPKASTQTCGGTPLLADSMLELAPVVQWQKAIPLSFPSSSGITKPIAFAAPVLDGIIDADAALALYKSAWATSNKL